MSARMQLKKAVIAIALPFLGLTASFNSAAQTAPDPIAATAQQRTKADALNAELETVLRVLNKNIIIKKRDAYYDSASDPAMTMAVERIKAMLRAGADPNYFKAPGAALLSTSGMTHFQAGLVLAIELKRPDLVQAFIDAGADVRLKAPDGWSPMDYAVTGLIESQAKTRSHMESAIAITKMLMAKGAVLDDAVEMNKRTTGKLSSFEKIALNAMGLNLLYEAGLITQAQIDLILQGSPSAATQMRATTDVTAEILTKNGATLLNYPDAVPGGPEPYVVRQGDTLQSIAERLKGPMRAGTADEAVAMIIKRNNMGPSHIVKQGDTILLPIPIDIQLGTMPVKRGRTLMAVAKWVQSNYYQPNLSLEDIARDIAALNGIDPALIDSKIAFKADQNIDIALLDDAHVQLARMTPPPGYTKGSRNTDLIVIEGADDSADKSEEGHAKNTYRVANLITYSINPDADFSQIHAFREMLFNYPSPVASDALRMLMNAGDSPARDRIIFSHSMAVDLDEPDADRERKARESDSYEYETVRSSLPQMEKQKPIIFTAAGNFWPSEGYYMQSKQMIHSPRTVVIGSAGKYKNGDTKQEAFVMSPYTSHAADVCGPLPRFLRKQMEGTSFSTPLVAAVDRQFTEWYGDKLTFEEIMAAGMMTADRNVLDYANVAAMDDAKMSPADRFKTSPAKFRTNGGGLPNHDRCGAGVIDVVQWKAALDKMITLKAQGQDGEGHTTVLRVGKPVIVPPSTAGGLIEYHYRFVVPSDMTLGKLTFLLPQEKGRHSEIVVRTPGGFEKHMPKAHTDIISTFAFAYEDVRGGQVIEIRTTEPLGSTAGIMLRGHAPGNAIAKLRDLLRSEGVIPAPNQMMSGNQVTGPAEPLTTLQDQKQEPAKPKTRKQNVIVPFSMPAPQPITPIPRREPK